MSLGQIRQTDTQAQWEAPEGTQVNQTDRHPGTMGGSRMNTCCCRELVSTCCCCTAPKICLSPAPQLQSRLGTTHPQSQTHHTAHPSQSVSELKDFTEQGNRIIILKTAPALHWIYQNIFSSSVLFQCVVSARIRSTLSIQVCTYVNLPFLLVP